MINVVALSPNLLGDATPRLREFARSTGGVRTLRPPLPAVTCTSQSTMLTGLSPCGHGVVGNGWHDRSLGEVHFWKQSNGLVAGEKVWETARRIEPGFRCANVCWWYAMHASTDRMLTPRPQYRADGRKVPDCLTRPAAWREELRRSQGAFPLFRYWGPLADITSTQWIAGAAIDALGPRAPAAHGPGRDDRHDRDEENRRDDLVLVYLSHLDYALQKFGPGHPSIRQEARELDRVVGALLDRCRESGHRPLVVSEYGIVPVRDAVWINRVLRDAGYVAFRVEEGQEHLDLESSRAFAVADHQIAHVSVRDPADVADVESLLARTEGIERTLSGEARRAAGLDHPRAGDVVCVSAADRWFAYGWWLDERRAPDFARTVDIHRKPGYDPCELFHDPKLPWPKGRAIRKLLLRKLGFRALLDVIPLDASLVRGSHGRVEVARGFEPVLLGELPEPFLETSLPMECVRDAILAATLGAGHASAVETELLPATRALLRGGRR